MIMLALYITGIIVLVCFFLGCLAIPFSLVGPPAPPKKEPINWALLIVVAVVWIVGWLSH